MCTICKACVTLVLAIAVVTPGWAIVAFPETVDLDSLFWDGPLGAAIDDSSATFHIFAPRALRVHVHLFGEPFQPAIASHALTPLAQGCWAGEVRVPPEARYYGYTVAGPDEPGEMYDSSVVVADPYSPAVVTENHYTHGGRTLLYPPGEFDWEGDTGIPLRPEDLIIYEAHVRDLTVDPSSGVPDSLRGTYLGLCHKDGPGGLPHLLRLGVNAVEFLPLHEFGNLEVSYRDSSAPVFNTWNPYERNHWGYMTSYFFAPEAYYATGQSLEPKGACGADGRQVTEFKQMVKTLHRHGIAVIVDVVYNHVSQYDLNSFKLIDKEYYFRLAKDGTFLSLSGCGNDFKTERPMARRLIVDSILHWMREYHVDGFRFDLATMIDDETLEEITRRARGLNPAVILVAEPWGGGEYDLGRFSRLGWSVWNDRIRNGIKGRTPGSEHGLILGAFLPGEDHATVLNHLMGSVIEGGGPLLSPLHAVNYLESHDDHTLGDFVRIALGKADAHAPVADMLQHVRLTQDELRVHRLASLALCCSQGSIMLAQGQEFARTKVIAPTAAPDTLVGYVDHNSYNKDNATNWLNYDHAAINNGLIEYYGAMIALRKAYRGLGEASCESVTPLDTGDSLCVGLLIASSDLGDPGDLLVFLNGSPRHVKARLPRGRWVPLVIGDQVGTMPNSSLQGQLTLPSTTGALLIREP
ncbi:pullulanase [Candidatus Fermentibacteria bacterium]|nr:pullulanase [Candidatus Fermentibacteria bacterium]